MKSLLQRRGRVPFFSLRTAQATQAWEGGFQDIRKCVGICNDRDKSEFVMTAICHEIQIKCIVPVSVGPLYPLC